MLKDIFITIIIFTSYVCIDIFTPVNSIKSNVLLALFSAITVLTKPYFSMVRLITLLVLSVGSYTSIIYIQGIGNINKISGRFPDIAARWWKSIWVMDIKIVAIVLSVTVLCTVVRKFWGNRLAQKM